MLKSRLGELSVRFGKKTKGWAAAGRRLLGEKSKQDVIDEPMTAAVATKDEVRNALIGEKGEAEMTTAHEETGQIAGDPTQRLLTSLGRFQRQVSKAESGAPQESWSDECMNQVITAMEIAIGQDWEDIKEALTDTARILQSYEDADQAALCIPFLQDSYEILCLMVGDLIVDNVRSGVMKKWRDRYEVALADLGKAGLSLVEDEAAQEQDAPPEGDTHIEDAAWSVEEDSASVEEEPGEVSTSDDSTESVFGDVDIPTSSESEAVDETENTLTYSEEEIAGDAEASAPDIAIEEDIFGAESPLGEESQDMEDAVDADRDAKEESMPDSADTELDVSDIFGEEPDDSSGEEEATQSQDDEEIVETVEEESSADTLFEGPPELSETTSTPTEETTFVADEIVSEADEKVGETASEELIGAEQEVEQTEIEEGSPQALLATAQKAMASGDVANAKALALQLAAAMAKLEVEHSETDLQLAEEQLNNDNQTLSEAEQAVREAEEQVQHAETQVVDQKVSLEEQHETTNDLREKVAQVDGVVTDLNQQIADLEAKRDEEMNRKAGIEDELDKALNFESNIQSELDALFESEEAARDALEKAMKQVAQLQKSRNTHETAIEEVRQELSLRQESVTDIEKTIIHVTEVDSSSPEKGEGLF
jgi:hypothetical protein